MHTTNTNTPRTTTMTALVQTGFGDPSEVLRVGEVERPEPADDRVLVRVHAASVHIGTVYGVRGFPKLMRPMFKTFIAEHGVIGQHMAGTVEAVGRSVTDVTVGDEVVGWCSGAYAQYAVATSEAWTCSSIVASRRAKLASDRKCARSEGSPSIDTVQPSRGVGQCSG